MAAPWEKVIFTQKENLFFAHVDAFVGRKIFLLRSMKLR